MPPPSPFKILPESSKDSNVGKKLPDRHFSPDIQQKACFHKNNCQANSSDKPPEVHQGFHRQILQGTAGAFAVRALAAAASLLMNVLLARVLSVSDYGVIALGLSWLNIVATLACFGTDTVSVRYIAEAKSRGDDSQIAAVMRWGQNLTMIFGTAVGVASCGLLYTIFSNYRENQLFALCSIVMAAPLLAFTLNRANVLRGVKKVVSAATVEMLLKPLGIILLVGGGSLISGWSTSMISVAFSIFLVHMTMAWVGRSVTHNLVAHHSGISVTSAQRQEWFQVAKSIVFMNVLGVLIGNMDTVFVGYFVDAGSAGIYRASAQLASLVSFGLGASNGIMAPLIAELYSNGKHADLRKTLRFSVALVGSVGVVSALTMGIWGEFALKLFGPEYQTGYYSLLILLTAQAINALCGPTGFMMSMTGHQVQAARLFTMSALISALLNILLIPSYGILGAAAANAIGIVLWNLSILVFLKHRLKIDPSVLVWLSPDTTKTKTT
ncbi:MAG: oligosaccharide flippase family protein [Proteobacteria bacterium]|nr:oligosaccharide flippase family protein [Pseudomonadota bacterium]